MLIVKELQGRWKMEKVKIKNCEPIFDGKAHSVEFVGGMKATAWNDKIDSVC